MSMNLAKLRKYKLFKNEELLSLELLKNQGFCNINYLLKSSKNSYVVRKFKDDSSVNISRKHEFKIQKKVSKKGLASKPLLLDEENQLMICHYLKGHHKDRLKNKEIKLLAKSIKKLHKIKSSEKEYDFKKDLKHYKETLKGKRAKESIAICKKELSKLKKYKKELVTTHHDLNPKNILFYKDSIKFIDWEYVGVNDKFFDLASVCFEFEFSKKDERVFLKSYLKRVRKRDMDKLHSYILIYKHFCKLWFMALN